MSVACERLKNVLKAFDEIFVNFLHENYVVNLLNRKVVK